jgi:hypothetical protein
MKAFGAPDMVDLDKSSTYWSVQFANGTVATIYDYFGNGAKPVQPAHDEVISWHIGGRNRDADMLVHEAFRAANDLKARAA